MQIQADASFPASLFVQSAHLFIHSVVVICHDSNPLFLHQFPSYSSNYFWWGDEQQQQQQRQKANNIWLRLSARMDVMVLLVLLLDTVETNRNWRWNTHTTYECISFVWAGAAAAAHLTQLRLCCYCCWSGSQRRQVAAAAKFNQRLKTLCSLCFILCLELVVQSVLSWPNSVTVASDCKWWSSIISPAAIKCTKNTCRPPHLCAPLLKADKSWREKEGKPLSVFTYGREV